MRIAIVLVAVLALALPIQACSGGSSGAQTRTNAVAPYGPGTQSGLAAATTGFRWHTRLADAQAAARAQGKLILVTSTKPGCGLCEKFKNNIVPQVATETSRVAVGYVYDIRSPEVAAVDQTLRANLTSATLMPLVGFLTPELGWVHGFWGQTSAEQFLGDINTARGIYPVSTACRTSCRQTYDQEVMTAVVNEFGETEWSRPGDVWPGGAPEPVDAIAGAPEMDPMDPVMPAGAPGEIIAVAPPPAGDVIDDAPAPPPAPLPLPQDAGAADQVRIAGAAEAAREVARAEKVSIEEREPAPSPAKPPNPPFHVPSSGADLEKWAENQLQAALRQIEDGRYDSARKTLSEVQDKLPGTVLAREAARGSVAIYNHKRIRGASGAEAERYKQRANRDLGGSMWAPLFS